MSQLAVQELASNFDRRARAKLASNHGAKRLVVLGKNEDPNNRFLTRLSESELELRKTKIEILQINVGKLCNLTCNHCHVEAGPNRKEIMSSDTGGRLVELARTLGVHTVDLTGGAPEMVPGFKDYVREFRALGANVIVRSNLTILLEPGYEDFIEFFRDARVQVIASLPCYLEENVDKQRGDGVYHESIEALQQLNAAGFGVSGTGLLLDLVYNPGGPSLPGPQQALEKAYKKELQERFGIVFNSLYCITNLPIGRFYSDLKKSGEAEAYDQLLYDSFNSTTVPELMCRNTLNVSWDGWVYDCDFNQMLELPTTLGGRPVHVCDREAIDALPGAPVATGNHCFGCTAGAGSSCGGELA